MHAPGLIEELIRAELDAALARPRYGRRAKKTEGGRRCKRRLGKIEIEIEMPRARL